MTSRNRSRGKTKRKESREKRLKGYGKRRRRQRKRREELKQSKLLKRSGDRRKPSACGLWQHPYSHGANRRIRSECPLPSLECKRIPCR